MPVISSGRFIVSRFWPLGLAATIASVAGAVGADVVAALVCALALREHEVFRLVEKRAVADFAEREIDDAVVRLFWDELRPLQRLPFLHAPRRPSRRRPPRRARELALRPWARTAAADEQRRPKASRGRDPNHPQQPHPPQPRDRGTEHRRRHAPHAPEPPEPPEPPELLETPELQRRRR